MLDKLCGIENRYKELETILNDPKVVCDRENYPRLLREHKELSQIISAFRSYKQVLKEMEESKELLGDNDPEIKALAKKEIEKLSEKKAVLEKDLKSLLIPKDPNDHKNVILEIRAGTGGEEASLFAADLFRMYCRYAEKMGWKVEILSAHESESGGYKEVIAIIKGEGAYSRLKFESGTHRVQRVPVTEAQGRIHTSAVTVAVLPEAEDVDIKIDPADLKIDVFRGTGPGGQSVNTTDSAVRITHIPTGLVVVCRDERSQLKNKAKAMKVLRARLYEQEMRRQNEKISKERKNQVGSGDRSERIRTYNFPQGRVTDHRIGLTLYKLEQVLQGDIEEIIDALITDAQARSLEQSA